MDNGDRLLTPAEAGELLGVHAKTVTRLLDDGTLPKVITPGGQRRVYLSKVLGYRKTLGLDPNAARRILIANQKGGVLKTTTTLNWGVLLAQAGARVLWVDLDTQGHLTLGAGYDPDSLDRTLYDALLRPTSVPLPAVIVPTDFGPDLVPLNINASNMDVEFSSNPMWGATLRTVLATVADQYDYILMDGGPNLGKMTVMGLLAAEYLVIPSQAQRLSIHGLRLLLSRVEEAQNAGNPNLRLAGILLTLVQQVQADQGMIQALRTQLPLRVFDTPIPFSADYKKVDNVGGIMAAARPTSKPTGHFRQALAELLAITGGTVAPERVAPGTRVAAGAGA